MRSLLSNAIVGALLAIMAVAAGPAQAAGAEPKLEKPPTFDILSTGDDSLQIMVMRSNFNIGEVEYRKSKMAGDVDCERAISFSRFFLNLGQGRKRELNFSRQGSPSRGLYEWHICFVIDGVTYRGWRGYDPGPGTELEINCFIDKVQIDARDRSLYLCRTIKLTQNAANHGEYSIECQAPGVCRSFESEAEAVKWVNAGSLSPDELLEIAAAILKYQILLETNNAGPLVNYYLAIEGQDPPAAFLEGLSNPKQRFHPGSGFDAAIKAKKGGFAGMHLAIGGFALNAPGLAEGKFNTYCGPLCASGSTVTMEKIEGVWTVIEIVGDWIS